MLKRELVEAPHPGLVEHALTTPNTNLLTDADLRAVTAHFNLQPEGGQLQSTEEMIGSLATHYAGNADDWLQNFKATEAEPDTNCLLQDPFAEAAWLAHS